MHSDLLRAANRAANLLRLMAEDLEQVIEAALLDEQTSAPVQAAPVTVPLSADRARPRCPLCDAPLQLVEVWTEVADSEDELEAGISVRPVEWEPPATGYIWRCPRRHAPEGWPRDDD